MTLREYERKRDRKQTPEPFSGKRGAKEPTFVVQRHDARRLHYDFRLERDGALASWAVPKGVPLEPGQQHLACLRTYDDFLLLETMYYPDEVRSPASLDGDIGAARLQKAEVEMATSLVENLSESFDPEKYNDTYRKELLDLIRAKAKGRKLPEPQDEDEGEVVDLMTALRESVERTKKQRKRSGSSKTRAKAS